MYTGATECKERLPNGSGVSREAPAPFCEGPEGKFLRSTHHETFNTLKNLGYNFEHNYGHGKKYLSTILCLLMLLVFLIDQTQEIACNLFKAAKKRAHGYKFIWEYMRVMFQFIIIPSWEWLYQTMAKKEYLNSS